MGSELQAQIEVVRYLDAVGAVYCHVPNGGGRRRVEAANLRQAGVRAGVPDLLVFGSRRREDLPPIAIELKTERGRATEAQLRWLRDLTACGWSVAVCFGAAEAVEVLQRAGYG